MADSELIDALAAIIEDGLFELGDLTNETHAWISERIAERVAAHFQQVRTYQSVEVEGVIVEDADGGTALFRFVGGDRNRDPELRLGSGRPEASPGAVIRWNLDTGEFTAEETDRG